MYFQVRMVCILKANLQVDYVASSVEYRVTAEHGDAAVGNLTIAMPKESCWTFPSWRWSLLD